MTKRQILSLATNMNLTGNEYVHAVFIGDTESIFLYKGIKNIILQFDEYSNHEETPIKFFEKVTLIDDNKFKAMDGTIFVVEKYHPFGGISIAYNVINTI